MAAQTELRYYAGPYCLAILHSDNKERGLQLLEGTEDRPDEGVDVLIHKFTSGHVYIMACFGSGLSFKNLERALVALDAAEHSGVGPAPSWKLEYGPSLSNEGVLPTRITIKQIVGMVVGMVFGGAEEFLAKRIVR